MRLSQKKMKPYLASNIFIQCLSCCSMIWRHKNKKTSINLISMIINKVAHFFLVETACSFNGSHLVNLIVGISSKFPLNKSILGQRVLWILLKFSIWKFHNAKCQLENCSIFPLLFSPFTDLVKRAPRTNHTRPNTFYNFFYKSFRIWHFITAYILHTIATMRLIQLSIFIFVVVVVVVVVVVTFIYVLKTTKCKNYINWNTFIWFVVLNTVHCLWRICHRIVNMSSFFVWTNACNKLLPRIWPTDAGIIKNHRMLWALTIIGWVSFERFVSAFIVIFFSLFEQAKYRFISFYLVKYWHTYDDDQRNSIALTQSHLHPKQWNHTCLLVGWFFSSWIRIFFFRLLFILFHFKHMF